MLGPDLSELSVHRLNLFLAHPPAFDRHLTARQNPDIGDEYH